MRSEAPPPLPRFLDGLENLPEATVICDIDGGILVANRRAVALAPAMLSGIEDLAVRGDSSTGAPESVMDRRRASTT